MKTRRNAIFSLSIGGVILLIGALGLTAGTVYGVIKHWDQQKAEEEQERKKRWDETVDKTMAYAALTGLSFGLGSLAIKQGFAPPRVAA